MNRGAEARQAFIDKLQRIVKKELESIGKERGTSSFKREMERWAGGKKKSTEERD